MTRAECYEFRHLVRSFGGLTPEKFKGRPEVAAFRDLAWSYDRLEHRGDLLMSRTPGEAVRITLSAKMRAVTPF